MPSTSPTDHHNDSAPRRLVVLVTGGNRGLGRETARQLVAAGHIVYIGSRDVHRGEETARTVGGRVLPLDVTDAESVRAATVILEHEIGYVDVLVNNAGLGDFGRPIDQVTAESFGAVFDTNVIGVVRVTQALIPLLLKSAAPSIVNVSSALGSITAASDPARYESGLPFLAYAASKAALNMLTVKYASAYPSIRVNSVEPGYTATDITGGQGQSVENGAAVITQTAVEGSDGPTGTFRELAGLVPW